MAKRIIDLTLLLIMMVFIVCVAVPTGYNEDHPQIFTLSSPIKSFEDFAAKNSALIKQASKQGQSEFKHNIRIELKKRPLSALPLIQTYQFNKATGMGEEATMTRMLEVAHSRDRRLNTNTRLLLLEYLKTPYLGKSASLIMTILKTNPPDSDIYNQALTDLKKIALFGETVIVERLKEKPKWTYNFLEQFLTDETVNTSPLYGRLLQAVPSTPQLEIFQIRYMLGLIAAGRLNKAYAHWTKLLPTPPDKTRIFNETFSLSVPPPPFNWLYRNRGPNTFEQLGGDGGIFIRTNSSKRLVALQQFIQLPANKRYRFVVEGHENTKFRQTTSHWSLRCLNKNQDILFTTLKTQSRQQKTGDILTDVTFATPESCPAQIIEFFTKAPTSRTFYSISLNKVYIEGEN